MRAKSFQIELRIPGRGIAPGSVPPRVAAELAFRWFDLLEQTAANQKVDLGLTGFHVRTGSLRFGTAIAAGGSLDQVAEVGQLVAGYVSAPERAPSHLTAPVKACVAALLELPASKKAPTFTAGNRVVPILVRGHAPAGKSLGGVLTTIRVVILRSGIDPASVRLEELLGGQRFTLRATKALARSAGSRLGQEVEAEVELDYVDARIEGGRLLSFEAVAEGDAVAIWEAWFERNGGGWADETDVVEALRGV